MKRIRLKGQALTLVLIIVVVAIVIAFAITSRVVQDIKQQAQEKASTRAETLAETAVENLTQQIQSGVLTPTANTTYYRYNLTTDMNPGVCSPDAATISKQCDSNSIAQVSFYNMIVQFKIFANESIEAQLVPTNSQTGKTGTESQMLIHLVTTDNASYVPNTSSILVKGYVRTATGLKVVGECIASLGANTASCLPSSTMTMTPAGTCPTAVPIQIYDPQSATSSTVTRELGQKCLQVSAAGTTQISFYRIMPLLNASSSTAAYITISATGPSPSYVLPVPQMAMINAGVYTGGASQGQQVFQQSTRLVLLNKAVPEVADFVLYNGSNKPIVKQ